MINSKILRLGIIVFLTIIIGLAAVKTSLQYIVWKYDAAGPGNFFLPPASPISYFWKYSFTHFMIDGVLTLTSAFWIFIVFRLFIWFSQGRWADWNDLKLAVLGVLMTGWPNLILYLIFAFTLALIFGFYLNFKKKLISLTNPILISIFLTLLFGDYIIKLYG